jgi:hypothetical protein
MGQDRGIWYPTVAEMRTWWPWTNRLTLITVLVFAVDLILTQLGGSAPTGSYLTILRIGAVAAVGAFFTLFVCFVIELFRSMPQAKASIAEHERKRTSEDAND